MFKTMRRIEKQMTDQEALEIIKNSSYGILSVIQDNGYPYGLPLNYAYDGGYLYFHGAREGNRKDSINKNARVSFTLVAYERLLASKFDTEYDSVIVFGQAEEIFGEEKIQALELIIRKYSSEFLEAGREYIRSAGDRTSLIRLKIEHVTGKRGR